MSKNLKKTTKSKKPSSTKLHLHKLKIVYLGWGSLVWDSQGLEVPEWRKTTLKLPLEFSRASDGGFGRLTLVIDPVNGIENHVWAGRTLHKNLNTAIKAVRKREKSSVHESIAYINLRDNSSRNTNTPPDVVQRIRTYAVQNKIDAIIWTDLRSNWEELKFCKFTNQNVINYFRFLPMDVQVKILTYVYQATRISHIKTTFSKFLFKHLSEFQPPTDPN